MDEIIDSKNEFFSKDSFLKHIDQSSKTPRINGPKAFNEADTLPAGSEGVAPIPILVPLLTSSGRRVVGTRGGIR